MIFIPCKDGDIWEEIGIASIIFFAGHSYPNMDLMDSPGLKHAATFNKNLNRYFGDIIASRKKSKGVYGIAHTQELFLVGRDQMPVQFGLFQNRKHPKAKAEAAIITESVKRLRLYTEKWERIVIEYPGTKDLKEADVLAMLSPLPQNVLVYERPPEPE